MKFFVCLILLLNVIFIQAQVLDSDKIRLQYPKAVSDKEICKAMISELEKSEVKETELAYLGAFQAIWANHTINPISKLSSFKKGKKNIEKAIKQNPNQVEIRFIRLSIQYNIPKMLGYYSDIATDKDFVLKKFKNIENPNLKKLIRDFFEESDLLTKDEKHFLEN